MIRQPTYHFLEFRFESFSCNKKLTNISPNSGSISGGDFITIIGKNLSNASSFTFEGTSGNKTPQHNTTGIVDVFLTTLGGVVTDAKYFHYQFLTPIIHNIFPKKDSITGGNSVTISGSHLSDAAYITFNSIDEISN